MDPKRQNRVFSPYPIRIQIFGFPGTNRWTGGGNCPGSAGFGGKGKTWIFSLFFCIKIMKNGPKTAKSNFQSKPIQEPNFRDFRIPRDKPMGLTTKLFRKSGIGWKSQNSKNWDFHFFFCHQSYKKWTQNSKFQFFSPDQPNPGLLSRKIKNQDFHFFFCTKVMKNGPKTAQSSFHPKPILDPKIGTTRWV